MLGIRVLTQHTYLFTCILMVAWFVRPRPAWAAPSVAIFKPQPLDAETYAETFSVVVDLPDGSFVQLQLGLSNLGIGDQKGMYRLLLVRPNRATIRLSKRVGKKNWHYSDAPYPMFSIDQSYIRAGAATEVFVTIDNTSIRVTMPVAAKRIRPPGSKIVPLGKGKDRPAPFFQSNVIIPIAQATVVWRIGKKGKKGREERHTASGFAYMDHSRSTTMPADIASLWVRFRALRGTKPLLILGRTTPQGKTVGWVWWPHKGPPKALDGFTLHRDHDEWNVSVVLHQQSFHIRTERRLFRYAPVENLNIFIRGAAKAIVGNPVTYTLRAKEISNTPDPIDGILEITYTHES